MAHGSQRITTATAGPREQHLRSAEKTARESDRAEGVELGAICAAVAWSGVYSLHALCVFYFIAAGKIYAFIPTTVVLAWEMDSYIRTVPTKYFNDIAIVHFVFAALHAAFLLQPLARRVCVRVLPRRLSSLAGLPPSQRHRLLSVRSLLRGSARGVLRCITVFSVQSEYFEVVFVLREIIEVVLQSLQAYQMSIHIPRLLLNRVFVTLLVLNCWSTLVVHHVVNGKSEQRLLCLLADLLHEQPTRRVTSAAHRSEKSMFLDNDEADAHATWHTHGHDRELEDARDRDSRATHGRRVTSYDELACAKLDLTIARERPRATRSDLEDVVMTIKTRFRHTRGVPRRVCAAKREPRMPTLGAIAPQPRTASSCDLAADQHDMRSRC
ncbi:hypothetical protein PINS_up016926 [Pythium insidiosum]|nr:hypothetical protein PINS_up016926 [Pythium insidiosum]